MGSADKIIRVLVAIVFATLFLTGKVTGTPGIILLVIAIAFFVTSLVSFCPLYFPFKINTLKNNKDYGKS